MDEAFKGDEHQQEGKQRQPNPQSETEPPVATVVVEAPVNQKEACAAKDAAASQGAADKPPTRGWLSDKFAGLKSVVFWDVVFTAIVAVFAIGQTIVGYWQWDATSKQYSAMIEQNAEAARQSAMAVCGHSTRALTPAFCSGRRFFLSVAIS